MGDTARDERVCAFFVVLGSVSACVLGVAWSRWALDETCLAAPDTSCSFCTIDPLPKIAFLTVVVVCDRLISAFVLSEYAAPETGLLITLALTVPFGLEISAVADRFEVSVAEIDPVLERLALALLELRKSESECFFFRVVCGTTGKVGDLRSLSSVEAGDITRSTGPLSPPGNLIVP